MTYYKFTNTPVGGLLLVGDEKNVQAAYWTVYRHTPAIRDDWIEDASKFTDFINQLDEYFDGKRQQFQLRLNAQGTPFQKRVWSELSKIPYGQTKSYQQIAIAIGFPHAVRAVGATIGRNPLSIVVPCHRVIASNGALTGFAGGLDAKQFLLGHESILQKP